MGERPVGDFGRWDRSQASHMVGTGLHSRREEIAWTSTKRLAAAPKACSPFNISDGYQICQELPRGLPRFSCMGAQVSKTYDRSRAAD